jgi:hypothetical protein
MIAHQHLIHTFLDIQRKHMEKLSEHRDQYHENMHSIAHQSLDSSIKMLEGIHEHVSKDDSDHKSDIVASMIKAAIDSRHHFKNGLTHHKAGANIHKSHMRKLAMGAMAAFGLISSADAVLLKDGAVSQHVAAGSAVVTSVASSQSSNAQIVSSKAEAAQEINAALTEASALLQAAAQQSQDALMAKALEIIRDQLEGAAYEDPLANQAQDMLRRLEDHVLQSQAYQEGFDVAMNEMASLREAAHQRFSDIKEKTSNENTELSLKAMDLSSDNQRQSLLNKELERLLAEKNREIGKLKAEVFKERTFAVVASEANRDTEKKLVAERKLIEKIRAKEIANIAVDGDKLNTLGDEYFSGRNNKQNDPEYAVVLFELAHDAGSAVGSQNFGRANLFGWGGIEKNQAQAYELFRESYKRGYRLEAEASSELIDHWNAAIKDLAESGDYHGSAAAPSATMPLYVQNGNSERTDSAKIAEEARAQEEHDRLQREAVEFEMRNYSSAPAPVYRTR